jgi:hypothetical protein
VCDLLVTDHDLRDAGGIPEIDERDASVIAATIDPAREGDGLTDVLGSQRACRVCAKHGGFLLIGERGTAPVYVGLLMRADGREASRDTVGA